MSKPAEARGAARQGLAARLQAARQDSQHSAALMDRIYRRQRHIYDASRKFYLLGRDELIAELAARLGLDCRSSCRFRSYAVYAVLERPQEARQQG